VSASSLRSPTFLNDTVTRMPGLMTAASPTKVVVSRTVIGNPCGPVVSFATEIHSPATYSVTVPVTTRCSLRRGSAEASNTTTSTATNAVNVRIRTVLLTKHATSGFAPHSYGNIADFVRILQLFIVIGLLVAPVAAQDAPAISPAMSFFITSTGRGFGGNLGGLPGADALCRLRAAAVGRGDRLWRAYLSAPPSADAPAVHARERIGRGPWLNALGVQIAASVEDLHGESVNLSRETALTEAGAQVAPTRHDILTGSNPDGTLFTRGDATCRGWTSLGDGRAMVGHHNRTGGGQGDSWNSAHLSRGCSLAALHASLGDGLLYCFAADQ
jgi:hypothetical protein